MDTSTHTGATVERVLHIYNPKVLGSLFARLANQRGWPRWRWPAGSGLIVATSPRWRMARRLS